MNKEAGSAKLELVLTLLVGVIVFVATIVATYSVLVHWHVH